MQGVTAYRMCDEAAIPHRTVRTTSVLRKAPWTSLAMQVSEAKRLIWDEAIKEGSVVAYSESDKLVRLPPATLRASHSGCSLLNSYLAWSAQGSMRPCRTLVIGSSAGEPPVLAPRAPPCIPEHVPSLPCHPKVLGKPSGLCQNAHNVPDVSQACTLHRHVLHCDCRKSAWDAQPDSEHAEDVGCERTALSSRQNMLVQFIIPLEATNPQPRSSSRARLQERLI